MSIDVDAVCPITDGLVALAKSRSDEIVKEWGRLVHVWGTGGVYAPNGDQVEKSPTVPELAAACYAQGVRDAIAVAALLPTPSGPEGG